MRRMRACGNGLRSTFAYRHPRQPQIAGVDCLSGNLFNTVDALDVASHGEHDEIPYLINLEFHRSTNFR